MELLYSDEHFKCSNYSWHEPLIKILNLNNEVYEFNPVSNYLAIVYKGNITFNSGIQSREMQEGDMFVIPLLDTNTIEAKDNCRIFLFKLNMDLIFCDHFPLEKLYDHMETGEERIISQNTNEILDNYLKSLEGYMTDGLLCVYFLEIKIKEFLFILRAYYTKESLAGLFHILLNKDNEFSRQVFENVKKVKTVKELAESMYYSVSGFEKRFKKVFGISANKWMQQNISRQIFHEINCSNKTMKEIAYQFGFSPSYFNDYCKRIFHLTPSQLKEKK